MSEAISSERTVFVEGGKAKLVREEGKAWEIGEGYRECQGLHNILYAGKAIGQGDFHISARLTIFELARSAASFVIDDKSHFGFEGGTGEMFVSGPVFGGKLQFIGDPGDFLADGREFAFEVIRKGNEVAFLIDGKEAHKISDDRPRFGTIGFRPWRSRMQISEFSAVGEMRPLPPPRTQPVTYSIPTIDLSTETWRQRIVERTAGQYLGHPTTVLLRDNKTMLCTYPLGHGGPAAVLKRSTDGGETWSERLPVPENWATATNCPCLHRLTGPDGIERLFVLEGNGAMRQAVSLDEGETWTPLEPNGLHCVVAPITIVPSTGDRRLAMYHRGSRNRDRSPLTIWQAVSEDGGLTWGGEREIAEVEGADPCEPAVIRSPDGKQLAAIMRENSRRYNSLLMVSDDEGETWSQPVEVPASLTGDRHMPRYAHDERLVMTFRDTALGSPTRGDFVGWVGTYDDMVSLREGQYRIRLLNSPVKGDLGYPGLELLPDGTFVTTTYAVLVEGEKHSVVSVRFTLEDIDRKSANLPQELQVFKSGEDGCHTYRIPSLCVTASGTILAFCEGRRKSRSDFGDIDMVLKRSADNGRTWGPMQVLADDGENTMGNPCPVIERESGKIILLLCRNNERAFVMMSEDDGETFTPPDEITSSIKGAHCDWTRVATGPGHGIQMRSGRLVIPVWYMLGKLSEPTREYRSGVIYSDDAGATWKPGQTAPPLLDSSDECEVVETSDGRLCLNMRNDRGEHRRTVVFSSDGGETWSDPEFDQTLIEPICDASLIRLGQTGPDGEPVWLFSNPASNQRDNLTVRLSYDEGATWPLSQVLYAGPSAYSCLAELADGSIGCLYERGGDHPYEGLHFARFGLEWIADGGTGREAQ